MSCIPGEGPGASTEWQLLTYTYTGGEDGEFSIYRNGELLSSQKYDVKIDRLPVTDITATTATLNGELFTRDGKAACGVLFWGEEDFFQWYIFRHVYWDFKLDMGRVDPGKFHRKIDGLLPSTKYYFRYATQDAEAFKATIALRQEGILCEINFQEKSLKAQMRRANKKKARFVAIFGDEELKRGEVALRDMATSEQQNIKLSELAKEVKK